MTKQKVVTVMKSASSWLLGQSAGPTYLGAQPGGQSGLSKDLENGWLVKAVWEDQYLVTLLLEQ